MYTNIPSVQILISLLRQYNIRHLVISPGTRNTALAHSVETDPFFRCYSIVDERSAGYFALGIADALDVPVCVTCTAATATCNYMPAVKEAYERNLQLITLTADQEKYSMFHMEDQCINQVDMYRGYIRYAVDIPKVENEKDYWYCNRCINEAFLEMNHHGKGPVQINYHMPYRLGQLSTFPVENLPVTRKINRIEDINDFNKYREILKQKNRILVICGSNQSSDIFRKQLKEFFGKYNCAVVYDTFSNIADEDYISPKCLGDVNTEIIRAEIKPDLIITVGKVFYSTIKNFMPTYSKYTENWQIAIDGMPNDGFHCLSTIFECNPEVFFECMNKGINAANNRVYYNIWKKFTNKIEFKDKQFTNFKVIEAFCKRIPPKSTLHTSVLDSIRMSNYVYMNPSVECYANVGADGIDGALSTLLGQAADNDNLAFLLIGDLSFMYDMNAILSDISSNVRILVINNYAGAEFHKNFGIERISTLNLHIAAGHTTRMQQCAQMSDMEYLSADDMNSLDKALEKFISDNDKPVLLEVFTDAKTDADVLKQYWEYNKEKMPMSKKQKFKVKIKKIIGKKNFQKMKKFIGKE